MLGLRSLHSLQDKEDVIAKVYNMLKLGGIFVTSTARIGDSMKLFKAIEPIGKFLGLAIGQGFYQERIGRQLDRCRLRS